MPEKDGIETVKEILAIDGGALIFTMSGKDAVGDYEETARTIGARRAFQKPLEIKKILKAIREWSGPYAETRGVVE